jgi:hypothetical protein
MASSRKTRSPGSSTSGSAARRKTSTRSRPRKSKDLRVWFLETFGHFGPGLDSAAAKLSGSSGETWTTAGSVLPFGGRFVWVAPKSRRPRLDDEYWIYSAPPRNVSAAYEKALRARGYLPTPTRAGDGTKPKPSTGPSSGRAKRRA